MDLKTHELTSLIVDIQKMFHEQKKETYNEELKAIAELLERHKELLLSFIVKSLPNDEKVKAYIDTLPYYGTCTTEYNEGFEDGVKWLKKQIAK